MMRHLFYIFFTFALLGLGFPFVAGAFVSPEQVVVLVNARSSDSRELADYYMERRNIPLVNRVDLDLPVTETISREVYEQDLRMPLEEALIRKGLPKTIKVLVTVYGMPLRVQGPARTGEEEEWIADARGWLQSAMGLLREQEHAIIDQQASLAFPGKPSGTLMIPLPDSVDSLKKSQVRQWKERLTVLINERGQGIQEMSDVEKKTELLASHEKTIRRIFGKVGGGVAITRLLRSSIDHQRKEVVVQQILANLMHNPSAMKRTQAYVLVQEAYGLWGILAFAQWEVERYQQADGSASVDSELSFLWWEAGTYPLAGRLPNPFYLGYSGKVADWPLPLLLVSRIDAPTVTHARRMIDQAIATESRGLSGNVYVDARGMKKGRPLSYGYYDADLQNFARQFRSGSGYPVMLENTEQRWSQPGQAPNVALYVGWYRLRHYEDAFTFNPGAIAYHIASGEAVSIHNPHEKGWCKNALERGVTVTLGPVGEPYLDAFPLPTEFFGLLFSGKYSLVEAYYLSMRFLSWKMVLFGDPLYRPWSNMDSRRQQVAQTLLQERPWPVSPLQRIVYSPEGGRDLSKFPGKYSVLNSKVFSP